MDKFTLIALILSVFSIFGSLLLLVRVRLSKLSISIKKGGIEISAESRPANVKGIRVKDATAGGNIGIEITGASGATRNISLSPSDEKSVVDFLDAVKEAKDERKE